MRFLADESCDFAVVRALRAVGHDVSTVSDVAPGAEDYVVATLADEESRVLLTEDKDFGQLAYATGRIRRHLIGAFLVVEPGRARLGRFEPT
jgi:predicted nuclease of predicted toxin-antitoxin system